MLESPLWMCSTETAQWKQLTLGQASDVQANLRFADVRRQRWEGFGGCFNELGWIALNALSETDRQAVLAELFDRDDGLGLTY